MLLRRFGFKREHFYPFIIHRVLLQYVEFTLLRMVGGSRVTVYVRFVSHLPSTVTSIFNRCKFCSKRSLEKCG